MNIRTYALFIIFSVCTLHPTIKKNFIFDFGGVLIHTNKTVALRNIGLINAILCSFNLKISPLELNSYIQNRLFFILTEIEKIHNLKAEYSYQPAYTEKGNELPFLMSAWLQGLISCNTIKSFAQKEINNHPEWFSCIAEERIIHNLVTMIFTPQSFIKSRILSADGVAFIKRCKKEGHTIYALSNWDPESFTLLKEKYPEFFNLFDGIIISGNVKANKPHNDIYKALLNTYHLKPEDSWFIDDQEENIQAAHALGINAIRFTTNFIQLVKDIRECYSKLKRFESLNNNGINPTAAITTTRTIISAEYTSLND